MDKSPWQQEFDALPEWARKLVRGLSHCAAYGGGDDSSLKAGMSHPENYDGFHVLLHKDNKEEWWEGFFAMKDLAAAMTVPWPPPEPPVREKRAFNIVELATEGEDDCAFDQPCAFGHRVESHAVYCHNEAWPDGPRKCRRNRTDFPHEACPGFVKNPDWQSDHQ